MATREDRLKEAERVMAAKPTTAPSPPPRGSQMCEHSQSFADWCDALVQSACARNNLIALQQAKVHLLDRYFAWRLNVPARHQVFPKPAAAHVCIFAVFESAYHRLQEAVLAAGPPPFADPPSPPPSAPRPPSQPPAPRYTEVNGIAVAEILDDEFEL